MTEATLSMIEKIILAVGSMTFCAGISFGIMLGIIWIDRKAKDITK